MGCVERHQSRVVELRSNRGGFEKSCSCFSTCPRSHGRECTRLVNLEMLDFCQEFQNRQKFCGWHEMNNALANCVPFKVPEKDEIAVRCMN